MRLSIWIPAIAMTSLGLAALAHSGASGVVKQRMDAMDAMGEAMKRITPVMRRQVDYDPQVVRDAAEVMIMHAGEDLTELFPSGSNDKPSEALDTIWEDWGNFSALADALRETAEGMKLAAENGLAETGPMSGGGMMGMGQGMMGNGQSMMGGVGAPMMTSEMLAELPANVAFASVTQTCSACHQRFRSEDN